MAERSQKRRPAPEKRASRTEEAPGASGRPPVEETRGVAKRGARTEAAPGASERASGIKAELDDLLDEIDEVLEANAEEFVKSYIQKGGE